ncbi:hypothetical protein [Paenisporosarcina sp. TG20]|uniref:hypothetical protein n=1 Tax=Paenisporosarcina sp. TG20 TaxID=1211706 RepID=UPI0002E5A7AE|nr:hypothetical protein [Paenisporosarcina sp. TG20]
MSIEQVYLTVLVVMGISTILYIFFGDIADGIGEGIPFLNPAVLLAFGTLTSASGYILEATTLWNSWLVLVAAGTIGVGIDFLLYYFILLPMSSSEVSLAYTDESLAGQLGKVITPIPIDGYGEIVIETVNGLLHKRSTGYDNEEIDYGKEILVIDVKEGTFLVREYEAFDFIKK